MTRVSTHQGESFDNHSGAKVKRKIHSSMDFDKSIELNKPSLNKKSN